MPPDFWKWVIFNVCILALLLFDLGVLRRKSHEVKLKEALVWSAFWILLSLAFCAGLWKLSGPQQGLEFLTGYLIEKSLSVDNIFVFILIFTYFRVPPEYRHKVLFWGIMGALVMRAIMIYTGVALIQRFEWIIYVFGVFLVYTGIRMVFHKDEDVHPGDNPVVKLFKRMMPVSEQYDGNRFFTVQNGKRYATPLFVVLLVIETSDLIFAVDSIPAIIAISRDPFIVYTSNVFAILGLRSLYFALAGIMGLFHYLKYALSFILSFVGVKMLLSHTVFKIPIGVSLAVIASALILSVIASLLYPLAHQQEVIEEAEEVLEGGAPAELPEEVREEISSE